MTQTLHFVVAPVAVAMNSNILIQKKQNKNREKKKKLKKVKTLCIISYQCRSKYSH